MESPGRVVIPDIVVPISGEGLTITAEAQGVTATTTIEIGPAVGSQLYAALLGWGTTRQVQLMNHAGLPSGYAFTSVYASDGQTFVTLADNSVWVSRDSWPTANTPNNKTWHNTGLKGKITDAIVAGTSREGEALVLQGGVLTSVFAPNSGAAPTVRTVPNPPSGAPVQIASSRGIGAFYAETSDGRLWSTPSTGTGSGTWRELTGVPTPVADWVVRISSNLSSEQVHAIGADGNYYFTGGSTTGVRPTTFVNARRPLATWTAPAVKFMKSHKDAATTSNGVLFVDSKGGLYKYGDGTNQDFNFAGVLNGQLRELEILNTPEGVYDDTSVHAYVVTGGRLYFADFISQFPMRDITPPAALLNGATIVDVHESSRGANGAVIAIDSTGRLYASQRLFQAASNPQRMLASGLPAQPNADGIVQDGRLTYVLGEPTTCPV